MQRYIASGGPLAGQRNGSGVLPSKLPLETPRMGSSRRKNCCVLFEQAAAI